MVDTGNLTFLVELSLFASCLSFKREMTCTILNIYGNKLLFFPSWFYYQVHKSQFGYSTN